ncbi:unnamed protein product [Linum trigynum]|uniref:Uncharacterized protein n=1 Tax=Linum trigynum TaxID=586398 RepID=A0AAV2FUH7_9ROSI
MLPPCHRHCCRRWRLSPAIASSATPSFPPLLARRHRFVATPPLSPYTLHLRHVQISRSGPIINGGGVVGNVQIKLPTTSPSPVPSDFIVGDKFSTHSLLAARITPRN